MSRKQVRRERRRTDSAMDEAFAALERGEQVLALRIARRARESGAMNVRILLDHARIARACGADVDAEESLRSAIAQAANCQPAFVALAELQAARGKWPQAVRLMARAVELEPADARAAGLLASYREQVPAEAAAGATAADAAAAASDLPPEPPSARILGRDGAALHRELLERGAAVLPDCCSADECAALRVAWTEGDGWDREIRLPAEDGAAPSCRARFALSELPPLVAELRHSLYPLAADLAQRTRTLLGDAAVLPRSFPAWQRARGGAGRPAARLLALAPGEVMPSERTADRRAFPLRLVVDLGPGVRADSLRILDARPGRKVRAASTRSAPGDALLFYCRERPQQVGGVYGLQLVRWSLGPFAAARWLLDVPFDDD